jgi:hypothetical protein
MGRKILLLHIHKNFIIYMSLVPFFWNIESVL